MRVFLDTNVLVSAFATRGLSADLLPMVLAEHDLILGEAVLTDLAQVLTEKLGLPPELVDETMDFLRREAEVIGESEPLGIAVRDKTDVLILEQTVGGSANVLVTGDGDLLAVAEEAPVRLVSPRGFWELVRDG